jgi:hypothetical protein
VTQDIQIWPISPIVKRTLVRYLSHNQTRVHFWRTCYQTFIMIIYSELVHWSHWSTELGSRG